MSFRTLKARPKPNLDFLNKRRALVADEKVNNEEVQSKTECSEASGSGGTTTSSAAAAVNEPMKCADNDDEKAAASTSAAPTLPPSEEVTKPSGSVVPVTKLKPRPRPNLALGSRPTSNASVAEKVLTGTKAEPEDCVIVGVSYTDGNDVSQGKQVPSSSSDSPSVAGDQPTSTDSQQRSITAKLKARPVPNLIRINRNKRPLQQESTPTAEDNSSSAVVEDIKHSDAVGDSPSRVTSEDVTRKCEQLKDVSPHIEEKTTNNLTLTERKQMSKRTIKTKPKKARKNRQKQRYKLNRRQLATSRKLRYLLKAVKYLEKIIAKRKKQINLEKARKQASNSSCDLTRNHILMKNRTNRMVKILNITKRKLKRSARGRQMNYELLYRKLLRLVFKEINKAKKKHITKSTRNDNVEKETILDKKKEDAAATDEDNKSVVKVDDKQIEEAQQAEENVSPFEEVLIVQEDIVEANVESKKVSKIKCKINRMIRKPSGGKSMRIKIFKDDGTGVHSPASSDMSSGKDSAISESSKEECSPSKGSSKSAGRRFNINTVKPNLATAANRNYKPIQYTTSYGKLNNAVKQKFKDKFGSKTPPEHSKLTMLDLIFYNPSKNPMSEKDKKKDTSVEMEITNEEVKQSVVKNEQEQQQCTAVDEDKECGGSKEEEANEEDLNESSRAVDTNGLPVPQLKITADGKVIIAPESLIVAGKNDEANKNESRPLIVENDLTHHKVTNKKAGLEKRNWSFQETLKFYRVLNETGSDFLSMASHFPNRTRNCLKRKFKREEKFNGELIDKVIGSRRIDFSHVEKELALNQMWDEVEKSCKRRSRFMPEIPDVHKGNISEMFLTKKEREMKAANSDDANVEENVASKQVKTERGAGRKQANNSSKKKKRKPKILRLKEYLSNNNNGADSGGKKTLHINLKCLAQVEPESANVSSEDEASESDQVNTGIPIVVNTRIESSGIKYTKSVTFNPGNMELPIDINETIAHTGASSTAEGCGGLGVNNQQYPSSSEIIKQIVDILSTDETPSILCEDNKHVPSDVDSDDSCQQDNSDNQ